MTTPDPMLWCRVKRVARGAAVACATGLGLGLAAMPASALQAQTVVDRLDNPWALAFLPDGRMLVTERTGGIRIVEPDGRLSPPLEGLPAVDVGGQCGLLDVAVDPQFASNQLVYWSFAEAAPAARVATARHWRAAGWSGATLQDVRVIFSQKPKIASRRALRLAHRVRPRRPHLAGAGRPLFRARRGAEPGQPSGQGHPHRSDGKVPADNPFVQRAGAAAEVWSLGHRNIQGAAHAPGHRCAVGQSEHGPQGGDEVNIAAAGRNYGWPVVTYGRNYGSGTVHRRRRPEGRLRASRCATGCRRWRPAAWPSSPATAIRAGRAAC